MSRDRRRRDKSFRIDREARNTRLRRRREVSNLDVDVLLVPEGNSRQPVLFFDRLAGAGPVFGWEFARCGLELRSDEFARHRAGRNSHLWIVPDTLAFPRITASLHVQFVLFYSKPHGRTHGSTALAKRGKADVLLPPNFGRDGHNHIVWEERASRRDVSGQRVR